MLDFLSLENYKNLNLIDKKVYLKNLNIFIGSNGSGKSNFISCLQFLNNCLTSIPEENRSISSFEEAVSKIGNDKILDFNLDSPARVRLAYGFLIESDNSRTNSYILDLSLFVDRVNSKVNIDKEYLYDKRLLLEESSNNPFFFYMLHKSEPTKGVVSVYKSESRTEGTRSERLSNISNNSLGLTILPSLLEKSQSSPENTPAYKARSELVKEISRWKFYNANNMDLYKIRTSEPKLGMSDIYLSPSGDNLPLVLDNIISQNLDFEDSINIAMKSILPQTRRVRAARAGRLYLTVEWYFEGNNQPFYLNDMSDGTVRMLCWATILHSPFLPSLLVIDEPELGLHVAWMPILAEWIKQASQKTQIIITTHSPDLLDHFTDCIENVFCFQLRDKQYFSVHSLDETDLQPKLDEGWQLGDLYRVGEPIIGGWPW